VNDRLLQTANWIVVGVGVFLAVLVVTALARMLRRSSRLRNDISMPERPASSSNDQSFMLATFQGVIQRQKVQERELERLRQAEKERADFSQSINENITRNMPTGLIAIDRNGLVSSSNPAAKDILQRQLLDGAIHRSAASGRDFRSHGRELSAARPTLSPDRDRGAGGRSATENAGN